ncbi:methionyl-tRNA synthetase [Marchantia polymorpha subsp. ruderalis]
MAMRTTSPSLSSAASLGYLLQNPHSLAWFATMPTSGSCIRSLSRFVFPSSKPSFAGGIAVSNLAGTKISTYGHGCRGVSRLSFVSPAASNLHFSTSSVMGFELSSDNQCFSVGKKVRRGSSRVRAGLDGDDGITLEEEQKLDRGKNFVVTTPLYYVNAAPHMGSAYPTIAADALARFQRLQGRRVVFITGTDEHGEKIATAAAAQGREPKDHCDVVAAEYQSLWKELGIDYDRFIRTTEANHEKIVDEFYRRVLDKGDIYRAQYEGLYCVNCEEYKDEKELMEDNCCPIHRKPCAERKEDNYFFALSKYQQAIDDLLTSNPNFVRPSFRLNEVQGWVNDGLRDFSISRAAVEWGIPVPTDSKQTIYVWFDALLGYLSALLEEGKEPGVDNAAAGGWPASVHIIGKDILRFHAVYWPAMLMSAGLPVPAAVYGHGFLTKDGLKMGKSLGNTLEPKDLVSKFGPDAVRYYFLREIEFGKDGDFSEERFINIVNASLANTIGNLLNRTLGLLKKNCNATIAVDSSTIPEDHIVRKVASESVKTANRDFTELNFSGACDALLAIATAGNLYLDDRAPWSRFKAGGSSAEEAALDLIVVSEVVRIVAVGLSPVVPEFCRRIYAQLGFTEEVFRAITWEDTQWGGLKAGQVMVDAQPIFKRIEVLEEEAGNPPPKAKGKKEGKKSKQKAPAAAASNSV